MCTLVNTFHVPDDTFLDSAIFKTPEFRFLAPEVPKLMCIGLVLLVCGGTVVDQAVSGFRIMYETDQDDVVISGESLREGTGRGWWVQDGNSLGTVA
jgi:hypothetical protein